MTEFRSRVIRAVRRIPPGRVATYGDVATMAGLPRAWRAVGTALRACGDPVTPCHRVVGAGGALGGWTGPLQVKRERLRAEGVDVGSTRVRRFSALRWPSRVDRDAEPVTPAPAGPRRRAGPGSRARRTSARAGGR